MNDLFLNIITHAAFGTVTFLVGLWGGHRLAIGRDRRKEFNDAAAKFRSAFTEIRKTIRESQPGIRRIKQTDFFKLFTDSYHLQYDALIHFKDYLNSNEQEAIEKAWDEHCWNGYLDEKESHSPFLHYHYNSEVEMRGGQHHIIKTLEESFNEVKQLAATNVEKLLYFAKPK